MSVAAIDRAFQLLRALPGTDGTLSQLSRMTGLPVATVSRLMGSLESAGAVRRDDKAYRIGPAIVELATEEPAPYDLLSIATPRLSELASATNETAGIAQGVGTDLVHLGQVATEHDVSVQDWTGFSVGAHSGCIGLVMMAYWPPSEIDSYLAKELDQYVDQTVTDPSTIRSRLEAIRETGSMWTTDEYAQGVTTLAAPVRDRTGTAVAALHVHGPSFRFPQGDQVDQFERLVRQHARAMSAVLGWADPDD